MKTFMVILFLYSVVLIFLGVYLEVKIVKGIKTANKRIQECYNCFEINKNNDFLRMIKDFKAIRIIHYVLLFVNVFVIVFNLFNLIRLFNILFL